MIKKADQPVFIFWLERRNKYDQMRYPIFLTYSIATINPGRSSSIVEHQDTSAE